MSTGIYVNHFVVSGRRLSHEGSEITFNVRFKVKPKLDFCATKKNRAKSRDLPLNKLRLYRPQSFHSEEDVSTIGNHQPTKRKNYFDVILTMGSLHWTKQLDSPRHYESFNGLAILKHRAQFHCVTLWPFSQITSPLVFIDQSRLE